MKPHHIIKSFAGSQTGHDHTHFVAGTTVHLSDDLAAIVVKEGWAKPVGIPAMNRDTKVVGPEETKVVEPEETKTLEEMSFKELQSVAKAKGVKSFGMSQEKLLAALAA